MSRRAFFLLSFLVLVFDAGSLKSQTVLENNPGSLKWSAIQTPNFELLFPEGFDQEGQRVANTLEHLYEPVSNSLSTRPRKISVILQNRNSVSNGFVTLGPRRSEFFTTSPQDYNFLGSNNWLDLLSLHEFRHVVQFDKSRQGFTKFVSYIWGQNGQSGLAFVAVPIWFWEGDAVVVESAMSPSGRGRIPNFDLLMRTRNLEKGRFNYHKQYLGSFKDPVPSHYVIGYHMTSYLRSTQGHNIWDSITEDAFKKSIVPFTFSNAIKKYTGKYVVSTYNEMSDDITEKWKEQLAKVEITDFQNITYRKNSRFTSYQYPHELSDGRVLALKAGISDITTFVTIEDGQKPKRVFIPGVFNDPGFLSVGNDIVVWTEFEFHPRWRQKNYSVIKTFDLKTKTHKRLTYKTRYSGAAISPDGKKIVAINNGINGEISIDVLAAVNGYVLQTLNNPDNTFYSLPSWEQDSRNIILLKHSEQGKAIVRMDTETGEEEILKDYSQENVGNPVVRDGMLYYNSPFSGIDNIYALDLSTGQKYQVTSAKYAAYNPSVSIDGSVIYYNNFTYEGHDVVKVPNDPDTWKRIELVESDPTNYFEAAIEQEGHEDLLQTIPDNQYPVSHRPKGRKLFNIHSWGPYLSTGESDVNLGIYMNDILSQSRAYLGYNIDVGQNEGKWQFEYSYQNFFPIIDFEAYVGNRRASTTIRDTTDVIRSINYDWRESGFSVGLRVPLVLTHSKFNQSFSVFNYVSYNNIYNFNSNYPADDRWFLDFARQGSGILLGNNFGLTYGALLKQSKRDINPKWGLTAGFIWSSTPYGGDYEGGQRALFSRLFIPGFFKHHSINFYGAVQGNTVTADPNNYWFGNRVLFPRGYGASNWENFYTIRTMYDLTLWNADLAIGPIANIQRIRAELFYDYGFGQFDVLNQETGLQIQGSTDYNSFGTEILFDFNAFRIRALLSAGFRVVYVPENNSTQVELVIGNLQI